MEGSFLMDGRALCDPDKAIVLDTGSAKEMCDIANEGSYGTDCIVTDGTCNPMFEWFVTGRWEIPR